MNKKRIGQLVERQRKLKNKTMKDVYQGVCSESTYIRLESGISIPDFITLRYVFSRLGMVVNSIPIILGNKEYEEYIILKHIETFMCKKQFQDVLKTVQRYEKEQATSNPIRLQYILKMKAAIFIEKKFFNKAKKYVDLALAQTLGNFKYSELNQYLLSEEEWILIFMGLQCNLYNDDKKTFQECMNVLNLLVNFDMNEDQKIALYPKIIWLLSECAKTKEQRKIVAELAYKMIHMLSASCLLQYINQMMSIFLKFGLEMSDAKEYLQIENQLQALQWCYMSNGEEIEEIFIWLPYRTENFSLMSDVIKCERIKRDYSQRVLAELADMDVKTLSRIENGKNLPKNGTLQKLVSVLEIKPELSDKNPTMDKFPMFKLESEITDKIKINEYNQIYPLLQVYEKNFTTYFYENIQSIECVRIIADILTKKTDAHTALEECIHIFEKTSVFKPEKFSIMMLETKEIILTCVIANLYFELGQENYAVSILENALEGLDTCKVENAELNENAILILEKLTCFCAIRNELEKALEYCIRGIKTILGCKQARLLGNFLLYRSNILKCMGKPLEQFKEDYHRICFILELMYVKTNITFGNPYLGKSRKDNFASLTELVIAQGITKHRDQNWKTSSFGMYDLKYMEYDYVNKRRRQMRGTFFFSPNWCNSHPYMSIPCIMPYLKEFDIDVCDLNSKFYTYQRSASNLNKCYEKIKRIISGDLLAKYELIFHFLKEQSECVENIIHNINSMTHMEQYVLASLYNQELQIFLQIAYEESISLDSYKTIQDVLELIENENGNFYIDFYEDYFREHCLNDIDVVLISLAGTQQLISAFTLCRYLKQKFPCIKVIIGGNPFTKIANKIDESWAVLFEKLFDFVILSEGEYVIKDLLRCIEYKKDFKSVRNCIYMQDGKVVKNDLDFRVVDIEKGALPDFTGYQLTDYNVPKIILPYYVTRGCYWKKCTFCDHDFGYADCFRIKSIEKIVDDLQIYKDLYQVEYVHFVDEAIPPKIIEKLCYALLERKLEIKWFTCIKASKMFTENLCRLMKQAGAVFVSIGVESCSQSVLNGMNKGISLDDITVTLKNMKKAHIWAHCFMINNFEGEDDKARWDTFYFIQNHKNLFTSIGMGNFTLSRNAKIFESCNLAKDCETMNAFSNDVSYAGSTALPFERANCLCNFYNELNFTSYFFGKYIFEREHLAIWLAEREEFLNEQYMKKEYMNQIFYNKKFLLKRVLNEKLYVYSLMTKKFYVLPKQFDSIIEAFDGDIKKLEDDSCLEVFNNKSDIFNFLLDELYAS